MSDNEFQTISYKNKNFKNKNSQNILRDTQLKNLERRIHSPKVDLTERDKFYLVRIELPGVTPESIKIQIKEHQIVLVSGSKLETPTLETDRIIYRESKYNNFVRRIKLPGPIKYFNINEPLNFSNGVLYLTFEKISSSTNKNISHEQKYIPPIDMNEKVDWSEL